MHIPYIGLVKLFKPTYIISSISVRMLFYLNLSIMQSGIDLHKEAPGAVMIPIPLHRIWQRDRGFNQAQLIASELAQQWNLMEDIKY